jgi:TRAP-type C4-dicarboxylate transport system permease small subunit
MLPRLLERLYWSFGALAALFLLAIFAIMMVMSLGRFQFARIDIPAGDDIVAWCMVSLSFLGLAHTFRSGEMIRVGLLLDVLPAAARRWLELLVLTLATLLIGFFAWHAVHFTYHSWLFNDLAQGVLPVPLWIPQLGMALGLGVFALALAQEWLHVLRGGAPRYEKPKPKTAQEVIERAMETGV